VSAHLAGTHLHCKVCKNVLQHKCHAEEGEPVLRRRLRLEPCPFCGTEKAQLRRIGNMHFVTCQGCLARGPRQLSPSAAVRLWNDDG
jgi:Lar family restriction alleviation protein